eukprot:scaffold94736_cov73-Phaeocystis_antarctica.AAC.6
MWLTKLNSGRPGSAVDGTAEGLAPFSRVVDPIPPPTTLLACKESTRVSYVVRLFVEITDEIFSAELTQIG